MAPEKGLIPWIRIMDYSIISFFFLEDLGLIEIWEALLK
jgi:hypothetical protein